MLISVIVTCYNLEKYIAKALDSLIAQSYEQSLYEVIVVDDCSNDKSAEIIKLYSSVKYVKTPYNQGVLLATIFGMQHSNGEVITFLDGDDIWHSDKLSRVAARYSADPSLVFLTHNYKVIDENGNASIGLQYTQKIYNELTDQDQISRLLVDGILLRKNYVWLGSAYSIRLNKEQLSSYIDWVNSLPHPKLTYQDWPLAFWVAALCSGNFGYDQEELFSYRIHSANFSGDSKSLKKSIRNWSKAYYTSKGLLDIAEKSSCNKAIQSVCRSAVIRDEMILRLFENPKEFSVIKFFQNLKYFGSYKRAIKETIRVLTIKVLGLRVYFSFKKMLGN